MVAEDLRHTELLLLLVVQVVVGLIEILMEDQVINLVDLDILDMEILVEMQYLVAHKAQAAVAEQDNLDKVLKFTDQLEEVLAEMAETD
jgi:hypothetical protein